MNLEKFDLLLLQYGFERLAHVWQKWFGQDCFFLARIAAILFGVAYAWLLPFLAGIITMCLVIASTLYCINIDERRTRHAMGRGCENPSKVDGQFLRYFFLIVAAPLFIACLVLRFPVTVLLVVLFWISELYFSHCTPLPPAKSKVRQFLEQGSQKIKEFFSPAPEPAPVPIPVPSHYR